MAASAAAGYVVPIGSYLGSGIIGGNLKPYPVADQSMFQIQGPNGQPDPRGAFAAPTDAWNAMRLGYGTLPVPDAVNAAAQESMNRYLGDPNNGGAGGWNQRWNQWNATDVTGPDGRVLFSPVHQTGLNVSRTFGGFDPTTGGPANPILSNANQGFTYMQNLLASNPDLQTGNIMSGYRDQMAQSPFSAPGLSAYMNAIASANGVGAVGNMSTNAQQAIGGLGNQTNFGQYGQQLVSGVQGLNDATNFDQFGRRGINQTNALDTANLNQLTGDIDTASQNTLANQLQSSQNSMEAAGLGRSGAGQMALLQNQAQVMADANRQKNAVLAQFTDANANRGAAAINLATQQGYGGAGQQFGAMNNALQQQAQQGFGGAGQVFGANAGIVGQGLGLTAGAQNNWSNLQGNAALQALQGQQAFNQIGQQGQSNLYGQTMANANQRYGVDTGNYLNSLNQSQNSINQQMQMEANAQHMALGDWLGLQQNRDASQAGSLNQAVTLAQSQYAIEQAQRQQMLQAAMQPYNNMMTIATGTNQNNAPNPVPNFWQTGLASGFGPAVGGAAQGFFAQPPQNTYNLFGNSGNLMGPG